MYSGFHQKGGHHTIKFFPCLFFMLILIRATTLPGNEAPDILIPHHSHSGRNGKGIRVMSHFFFTMHLISSIKPHNQHITLQASRPTTNAALWNQYFHMPMTSTNIRVFSHEMQTVIIFTLAEVYHQPAAELFLKHRFPLRTQSPSPLICFMLQQLGRIHENQSNKVQHNTGRPRRWKSMNMTHNYNITQSCPLTSLLSQLIHLHTHL